MSVSRIPPNAYVTRSCNRNGCNSCMFIRDEDLIFVDDDYRVHKLTEDHPFRSNLVDQTHAFLKYYAKRHLLLSNHKMVSFMRIVKRDLNIDLMDSSQVIDYRTFRLFQRAVIAMKLEKGEKLYITRSGHEYET
jgi:hypothetical protein